MRRTPIRTAIAVAGMAALAAVTAGCADASASQVTTLSFFQFKGEALEDFETIIDRFEAKNPDIRVVQNQVADSETAIRTLLVKDRAPDVISLNANASFGQLARAGVFYDFSDEPVLGTLNPAVQEILGDLGTVPGEVNGLGYVNNANGIIYNRAIFADLGLEVPTTWEELIDVCDRLVAAGVTPFAGTLADSWTVMPSWNAIGAYAARDGFFDVMRAQGAEPGGDAGASFERNFADVMSKQSQLYGYAQDGYRGASYDDGSALFANGKVAMLMQGIWALSPVKNINPDIDAAIFPYPVPDDPDERLLVSGVDVVVTMPQEGPHQQEAPRSVNNHAAGGKELLPFIGKDLRPQALRGVAVVQDRTKPQQGSDFRVVHQPDLPGAARVRLWRRGTDLLWQVAQGTDHRRSGDAGRIA